MSSLTPDPTNPPSNFAMEREVDMEPMIKLEVDPVGSFSELESEVEMEPMIKFEVDAIGSFLDSIQGKEYMPALSHLATMLETLKHADDQYMLRYKDNIQTHLDNTFEQAEEVNGLWFKGAIGGEMMKEHLDMGDGRKKFLEAHGRERLTSKQRDELVYIFNTYLKEELLRFNYQWQRLQKLYKKKMTRIASDTYEALSIKKMMDEENLMVLMRNFDATFNTFEKSAEKKDDEVLALQERVRNLEAAMGIKEGADPNTSALLRDPTVDALHFIAGQQKKRKVVEID